MAASGDASGLTQTEPKALKEVSCLNQQPCSLFEHRPAVEFAWSGDRGAVVFRSFGFFGGSSEYRALQSSVGGSSVVRRAFAA